MEYRKELTKEFTKPAAVTLGKFDGIHLGHRLLIQEVIAAEKSGMISCVFSFDMHPVSLFSEREIHLIYTEEEKKAILQELGVSCFLSYPFTKETAAMEPETFIEKILLEKLQAEVIVVGPDYRFGKGRRGDISMLAQYANRYGFQLLIKDKLTYHGEVVSSTRIRETLANGELEKANAMLGQPYRITGTVVSGRQLGRTIGIPTINQQLPEQKLLPPNGVYAAQVQIDGKTYYGITNIGYKPTVQQTWVRNVETHLFDCTEDCYGKEAVVQLLSFVREEQKFDSVEVLQKQIQADILYVKKYFQKQLGLQ